MADRQPRNAWVPGDHEGARITDDDALARAAEIVERLSASATARPPAPVEAEPKQPPVLVSTAAGYTIGAPPVGNLIRPGKNAGWDTECWAFYDAVGELHYVAGQYGRAVSRARLYIAKYNDEGEPQEVKTGNAAALNRELLGGEARAGDVLYLSAVQQFMTGQSLIVIDKDNGWDAYSNQDFTVDQSALRRVRGTGGRGPVPYKVDQGSGSQSALAEGVHTIHMWDRHPGKASTVDSSVRAALPYLRELARLDQYVQALLLSRIALSGILQIPPGTEVAIPPELVAAGITAKDGNGLMATLAAIGVQNIQNPGTASAVLPVLLQLANAEHKIEHLKLDMPLTSEVNSYREINLKRLAMSMDMAPEAMSGFSDVKYSNAEWIQDESVKTHIMRRVSSFASALTSFWCVPALGNEYLVVADTSDLESDPDQTEAGIALYDRGELDGDGLRRMANTKGKAPEGKELLRQLAVRAITANPSLFPALAPLLGLREVINLTPEEKAALTQSPDTDSGTSPQPIPDAAPLAAPNDSAPNLPSVRGPQPLPARTAVPASGAALVAACDVVVCAALASAGSRWRKRVRARAAQCRGTQPETIYLVHPLCADRGAAQTATEHAAELIADRWPQVPRIAALHQADPSCLEHTLSAYVVGLIVDQRPHHPAALAERVCACLHADTDELAGVS